VDRETFRLKLWRQEYTFRVAANRQAVTRVNLEQASKVQMWKPTRPIFGEGRSGTGKKPIYAPVSVHRGNEDGMSGKRFMQRGRPVSEVGWRLTTALRVLVWTGVGEGHSTREVLETGWREGPLLLICF
jgi:hypothetical protein